MCRIGWGVAATGFACVGSSMIFGCWLAFRAVSERLVSVLKSKVETRFDSGCGTYANGAAISGPHNANNKKLPVNLFATLLLS
jgi:hypothetical protein